MSLASELSTILFSSFFATFRRLSRRLSPRLTRGWNDEDFPKRVRARRIIFEGPESRKPAAALRETHFSARISLARSPVDSVPLMLLRFFFASASSVSFQRAANENSEFLNFSSAGERSRGRRYCRLTLGFLVNGDRLSVYRG